MLCNGFTISQDNLALPNRTILDEENVKTGRYEIRSNSTLILRYLYESDTGVYSCQAQSSAGFDLKSTSMTVNNKPVRIRCRKFHNHFLERDPKSVVHDWVPNPLQATGA